MASSSPSSVERWRQGACSLPRGRLAKLSDADLAEYALKYHVDAFRRSKRSGINQVHHVELGWMSMQEYYRLQKVHDLFPLLERIIQGGYLLKIAIYSFEIEIIGTDVPIPIGAGLFGAMSGKIVLSLKDGNPQEALKWAAMIALPFGELVAMWILAEEALGIAGGLLGLIRDLLPELPEPIILPPPVIRP